MKVQLHIAALILSIGLGAQAADVLYQTSFEPPAFTPGLPIREQDNWEMYHDGEAISVSTINAHTGSQCLRFEGALLEQGGPNFVTAYCFSRALDALTNNPPAMVEITASVRLDGPQTGTNGTPDEDILSANLMAVVPQAGGQGELLGGFFVSSAGKIWSYSRVPEDNYKYSVSYNFGTYRTLTLRVDFIARQMTWIVDGVTLGSGPFLDAIPAERLASGYLYLNGPLEPVHTPELTYDAANYSAYFDDYSLVSVPLSPVNAIIEFASTNILADEFMPSARINLVRRGFTNAAVRVLVSTTNGTAIAGEDYEAVTTFVTFAAGETDKSVEIPLRDDYWPEPDKSFVVRITDLPPGATSPKSIARLLLRDDERPGSIDSAWASTLGLSLKTNEVPWVTHLSPQADGKLIVNVGVVLNREPDYPYQYWRIVRITPDGGVDPAFPFIEHRLGGNSDQVLHALPDGKLLVVHYTAPGPYRLSYRLNADGSQDTAFTTTLTGSLGLHLLPMPGGKVLVNGAHTQNTVLLNGQPMPTIFRLNNDGSPDPTFTAPAVSQFGFGFHPLPNGQIILTEGTAASTTTLRRLNDDGTVDSSFTASADALGITGLLPDENGRVIIVGYFRAFNGKTCNGIVRLESNGAIDPTFRSGPAFRGFANSVDRRLPAGPTQISRLPDGRIFIGGGPNFDTFDGLRVNAPLVLNADGTRDLSFEGTLIPDLADPNFLTPVGTYALPPADGQDYFITKVGLGRLRMDLPLRIVSTMRDENGANHMIANALAGRRYTLQGSETLTNWTDLTTQSATTNRIEFLDMPTGSPAQRFYRVKQE